MIYESRILAQSNVYLSNVDCTIFFIEESAGIEIQLSFYLALFNLYLIISEIIALLYTVKTTVLSNEASFMSLLKYSLYGYYGFCSRFSFNCIRANGFFFSVQTRRCARR